MPRTDFQWQHVVRPESAHRLPSNRLSYRRAGEEQELSHNSGCEAGTCQLSVVILRRIQIPCRAKSVPAGSQTASCNAHGVLVKSSEDALQFIRLGNGLVHVVRRKFGAGSKIPFRKPSRYFLPPIETRIAESTD